MVTNAEIFTYVMLIEVLGKFSKKFWKKRKFLKIFDNFVQILEII